MALIVSAATYVYLLSHHPGGQGTFPNPGYYTWTSDRYRETHLVVGVFGRERPIVVAPLSGEAGEGRRSNAADLAGRGEPKRQRRRVRVPTVNLGSGC